MRPQLHNVVSSVFPRRKLYNESTFVVENLTYRAHRGVRLVLVQLVALKDADVIAERVQWRASWMGSGSCCSGFGGGCGRTADGRRPGPEPQLSQPNILLVTLDTTRADVLGCYGGGAKASPNLDRIAGRSHLFERCEASVPQTMPSHTTIFSGLHPFNHGVRKNLAVMVGPEVPLIAEELHDLGYTTGAFVSSFVVDGRFGFGRGFDHYDGPDTRPSAAGGMERRAGATVRIAIDWIAAQPAPWFVWVHLFDPHAPYDPPPPFAGRFAGNPYAGEVAYMDNEVGRLLGSLVARGEFDPAMVIIAGDHGEALGEHGEETHGILLYEATTRVPLLIHMPGQTEAVRHPQPVGLIDLAPTLRDLLGIETSDDGVSLLSTLRGESVVDGDRTLYIESLEGYLRNGWAPLFAVVRGSMKIIDSPRPELYDLATDPNELSDLAEERPGTVAALDRRLTRIRPDGEAFGGATIVLSPDEEAALLALGYVVRESGRGCRDKAQPRRRDSPRRRPPAGARGEGERRPREGGRTLREGTRAGSIEPGAALVYRNLRGEERPAEGRGGVPERHGVAAGFRGALHFPGRDDAEKIRLRGGFGIGIEGHRSDL